MNLRAELFTDGLYECSRVYEIQVVRGSTAGSLAHKTQNVNRGEFFLKRYCLNCVPIRMSTVATVFVLGEK